MLLPPLKEISFQDLWRRGHKKRWKTHWSHIKKDNETVERRKTSLLPMPLFLPCVGDIAPYRIRLCFMTLLVLRFPTTRADAQKEERTFSNSNVKDNLPIGVRTSKLNRSSTRSEMIFSWMVEHDGYIKARWDHDDMARKWIDTM
jgi:hypothetical protein